MTIIHFVAFIEYLQDTEFFPNKYLYVTPPSLFYQYIRVTDCDVLELQTVMYRN